MKLDEYLHSLYGHTTIDLYELKSFVKIMPDYMGWGYIIKVNQESETILNHADYFEFHFRRYLIGMPKTLHRVFQEVRKFRDYNGFYAHHFVHYLTHSIRKELAAKEWYEMLDRLEKASKKIEFMVPNPDELLPPPLLYKLVQSYPGHKVMRSSK